MKKITLILISILCLYNVSFAQLLVYTQNGQTLPNNAQITVNEVSRGIMDAHISIKNQGSTPAFGTLTITVLEEPIGGSIGYCGWGLITCNEVRYGSPLSSNRTITAGEEVDPEIEAMDVDEETVDIKVEYRLSYLGGEVQVVTVHYITDLSSIKNSEKENNIKISRNGSETELAYSFRNGNNKEIEIYSITGSSLFSTRINQNNGKINLPFNRGIYLYCIKEDGKILETNKFLIP